MFATHGERVAPFTGATYVHGGNAIGYISLSVHFHNALSLLVIHLHAQLTKGGLEQ